MDELAFLNQAEVKAFIAENEHADIQKLLLNPPKVFKSEIRLIVDQIQSRNKLKNKLSKWLEADVILPPPVSSEQTSSEETSAYKSSIFWGRHLVDLTGGMGVDTIALSKNFQSTEYVEQNAWLCQLFQHNQEVLRAGEIKVHLSSAESFLDRFEGKASFYIDPSRRQGADKVYRLEDCQPDVVEMLPLLRKKGQEALVKTSPMLDIKEGIRQLHSVRKVHVVSVKNECKELLFHLDFEHGIESPRIVCVNISGPSTQSFDFKFEDEKGSNANYSVVEKYLYDPNTSILKAGAFNLIGEKYGLTKLARHTHLYTSNELRPDFPGRIFEVIETDVKTNQLKKLIPHDQANIMTKNYPLSSEALKNRYRLKDGGDHYLIGFRDLADETRLIICKRVS